MWVVNNRKLYYTFSGILIIISLSSVFVWGLKPGIDFTGGTLVEIQYQNGRPDQAALSASLAQMDPTVSVRASGPDEYIVRMKPIDEAQKESVLAALHATMSATTPAASSTDASSVGTVKSFDSVGPVLGAEALRKAYVSVILVILGVVSLVAGFFISASSAVSLGLSLGGILALIVGSVRYWSDMNDYLRFGVLSVALAILIWVGVKKAKN